MSSPTLNAGRSAAKRRAVKRAGGGNGGANLKTTRLDPTRTVMMRKALTAELRRRFARLKAAVVKLVVGEDAFGADRMRTFNITTNAGRWYGQPDREKVKLFAEWLKQQMGKVVAGKTARDVFHKYALEGMKKGAGRAFDDVRKGERAVSGDSKEKLDFYNGSRDQFLRESFRQPVAVQRVEALAGRSFDDLENITTDTSARMSRTLLDGLVQGKGARELARDLTDDVDIGRNRAEVIARTEIIRAHAEGQLQSMEEMGVAEVGVEVEWSTAGDLRVCPECEAMEGTIYSIEEARGVIPLHPNCRCAWLPANVGEPTRNRRHNHVEHKHESIFNMTMEDVYNSFCPTGEGGGVDPTCGKGTIVEQSILALHDKLVGKGSGKLVETIKTNYGKLPQSVRTVVEAGVKTAFTGWIANQALAEQIAKEQGLNDHDAAKLRATLVAADIAAYKPAAIGLAFAGPVASALSWVVPPVTGAYLLTSAATSPFKTLKAAYKLVKKFHDDHTDVLNTFCATGEGGGVDPTCSPGNVSKDEEGVGTDKSRDEHEKEIHHLGVNRVVKDLQEKWNYHGDVKVWNQEGRLFEVGGVKWREGGNCYIATGQVNIHSQSAGDSVQAIEHLAAHEMMHGTWEKVYMKFEEERKKLEEPAPETKTGVKMRYDGDPYPQYAKEVETYSRIKALYEDGDKHSKFIMDDGITEYSKAYWREFKEGKVTYHMALHETLAEIAGIHESTGRIEGSKVYRDLYKGIRDEYKVITGQSKTRKGPGLVKNEAMFVEHDMYLDDHFQPTDKQQSTWLRWWKSDGSNGFARRNS